MPLFTMERTLTGWTEEDLEVAKLRSETCALHFDDLRWIRSLVDLDLGHSTCIYEAVDAEAVREHSRVSKLPCDRITEVIEVLPEMMAAATPPA